MYEARERHSGGLVVRGGRFGAFEGQLGFVIRFLNLLVERVGELQPNLDQFA